MRWLEIPIQNQPHVAVMNTTFKQGIKTEIIYCHLIYSPTLQEISAFAIESKRVTYQPQYSPSLLVSLRAGADIIIDETIGSGLKDDWSAAAGGPSLAATPLRRELLLDIIMRIMATK